MKQKFLYKEAIIIPIVLIVLIWLVYGLETFFGMRECYGIVPLNIKGLRGIILSPLFHGSLKHLMSNTIPLFVLTMLAFQFYKKIAYFVLIAGWLVSGFIVWALPDFNFMHSSILSCHIGASGIVYVLAFFIFFSGVFRKDNQLRAISLIVVFLYGGIVWGMFPQEIFGITGSEKISWESHFSGGLIGFILAFLLRKIGTVQKSDTTKKQEDTNYERELWELYQKEYPEYFFKEGEVNNSSDSTDKAINCIYQYKEDSGKEDKS